MANTIIEPVMNLILSTPGEDPGPDYADNQNQDLTIIASHTHAPGSGVLITPTGLNINTNLPLNNNNLTGVYGVQFSNPSTSALLTFLYTSPQSGGGVNDLFYNDGAGNVIALTKAGLVNATIASLPGESYSGGTFTWKQGAGSTTPANFDIGSVTIRPNTAGTTNGVILGPPSGISSLYGLFLPTLPVSTLPMVLDSSGNMSTALITGSQIASSTITQSNINPTAGGFSPVGSIIMFGGTVIPSGWLLCDGSSYLMATYPNLSAVLFDSGTNTWAYGTADSTHFNVPDFRGIFPRGTNSGSGNDPDASTRTTSNPGGNLGDNIGSLQTSDFESHVHTEFGNPNTGGGNTGISLINNITINPQITVNTTNAAGTSTETRPINLYVNFIIKT